MKITNVVKELKIGYTIRVVASGSHNYALGEIYKVSYINDKDNTFRAKNIDDNWEGNWLQAMEIVLIQQLKKGLIKSSKQQFDMQHLDKVVLPVGHKKAILETLTSEDSKNKETLFVKWGFDAMFEKGRGIILLFYGLPGTGKTLCAESIAKYLRKDHLVMSTADIQSSIPGEAERNIKKCFHDAKEGKHLLVIDECDSLLYERNCVGMIMAAEINCLLSEIENFDGVCILTTNRNHKLDSALERRIALKLEFPPPTVELRERIWKTLIPKKCPLASDVAMSKLAEYELCGGNIKNVIFSAARKALHEKRKKIRMEDFIVSMEREMEGQEAFRSRAISIKDIGLSRLDNLITKRIFDTEKKDSERI